MCQWGNAELNRYRAVISYCRRKASQNHALETWKHNQVRVELTNPEEANDFWICPERSRGIKVNLDLETAYDQQSAYAGSNDSCFCLEHGRGAQLSVLDPQPIISSI
jgi:hypothetical protein